MLAPTCGYFSSTSNNAFMTLGWLMTVTGFRCTPKALGLRAQPATATFYNVPRPPMASKNQVLGPRGQQER